MAANPMSGPVLHALDLAATPIGEVLLTADQQVHTKASALVQQPQNAAVQQGSLYDLHVYTALILPTYGCHRHTELTQWGHSVKYRVFSAVIASCNIQDLCGLEPGHVIAGTAILVKVQQLGP